MDTGLRHDKLIVRELRPEELPAGLALRNRIFPPITMAQWNKGLPCTAVIAFLEDECVGFIPLTYRTIRLIPGVEITAAFENAVGVRDGLRGLGVGTKMMDTAADFLKDRADALFVYRSDERSTGYRFYRKTGHHDLLYTRSFRSMSRRAEAPDSRVTLYTGAHEIYARRPALQKLFDATYGSYGGFPPRHDEYWPYIIESPFLASHMGQLYLFTHNTHSHDDISAYLIAGIRKIGHENTLHILEMASLKADNAPIRTLLASALAFAQERGLDDAAVAMGDEGPFVQALADTGFYGGLRSEHIMARILAPQALFDKVWKPRLQTLAVSCAVRTPACEFPLCGRPDEPEHRRVTVEMTDALLTRWLLGRLALVPAVQSGLVTLANGDRQTLTALAEAIPFSPWEYHAIDYI